MDDEEDTIMMEYHSYTGTSHPSNHLTSKNCTLFYSCNCKTITVYVIPNLGKPPLYAY